MRLRGSQQAGAHGARHPAGYRIRGRPRSRIGEHSPLGPVRLMGGRAAGSGDRSASARGEPGSRRRIADAAGARRHRARGRISGGRHRSLATGKSPGRAPAPYHRAGPRTPPARRNGFTNRRCAASGRMGRRAYRRRAAAAIEPISPPRSANWILPAPLPCIARADIAAP